MPHQTLESLSWNSKMSQGLTYFVAFHSPPRAPPCPHYLPRSPHDPPLRGFYLSRLPQLQQHSCPPLCRSRRRQWQVKPSGSRPPRTFSIICVGEDSYVEPGSSAIIREEPPWAQDEEGHTGLLLSGCYLHHLYKDKFKIKIKIKNKQKIKSIVVRASAKFPKSKKF